MNHARAIFHPFIRHVQQLTGRIGQTSGTVCVRQVSSAVGQLSSLSSRTKWQRLPAGDTVHHTWGIAMLQCSHVRDKRLSAGGSQLFAMLQCSHVRDKRLSAGGSQLLLTTWLPQWRSVTGHVCNWRLAANFFYFRICVICRWFAWSANYV